MTAVYLPDQKLLQRTNDEDPLDYYYHPLTGWLYRHRQAMAIQALGQGPFENLIEIGYGSGILLPELARHCRKLAAVDIHQQVAAVQKMLAAERVVADLKVGSILQLDYAPGAFDAIVCLSVLEHMNAHTLRGALAEIHRISRTGATIVLGFPVRNLATDFFYRLVGFSPRDLHPSSHRDIIRAAQAEFPQTQIYSWPHGFPIDLALYVVGRCLVF